MPMNGIPPHTQLLYSKTVVFQGLYIFLLIFDLKHRFWVLPKAVLKFTHNKCLISVNIYSVYISQLIRFARVCNHVVDFNVRNKCLKAKLLQQSYRYHNHRKTFSKFYRRHYELISKFNVGLKTLLRAFRNQNFMVTWFTNLRNLLE